MTERRAYAELGEVVRAYVAGRATYAEVCAALAGYRTIRDGVQP